MKKYVPSLEICKRLKDVGFPQMHTLYYWGLAGRLGWQIENRNYAMGRWSIDKIIAAPFVDDIFAYLYSQGKHDFWIYHNAGNYQIQSGQHDMQWEGVSLAEAAAVMLLDLKEKVLI